MGNGKGLPPRAVSTIRLLIGFYLFYIDYQIFPDVMARTGTSKIVMMAFMALFVVAGSALIYTSARNLLSRGPVSEEHGDQSRSITEASEERKEQSHFITEASEERKDQVHFIAEASGDTPEESRDEEEERGDGEK